VPIIATGLPLWRAGIRTRRPKLHFGDVTYADKGAVGFGAQHDILELMGICETALRLQVQLEQRIVRHRLCANSTNRGLNILRLESGHHVRRRHAEARQTVNVKDDPHGISP
jgi:hypothetical protein